MSQIADLKTELKIHCLVEDLKGLGYSNTEAHCVGICDEQLHKDFGYCRRSLYTIIIQWW